MTGTDAAILGRRRTLVFGVWTCAFGNRFGRGLSGWVGVLVFLAVGGLISFPFGVLMAVWGLSLDEWFCGWIVAAIACHCHLRKF